MKSFLALIEDASTASTFRLDPALNPKFYEMTASLRDIADWRAMTYLGNSGGIVNAMDVVGYTMVSIKDNSIVPIARGDEHNTGWDALYDLPVDHDSYLPIHFRSNYLGNAKDIPNTLIAARKWLSYGGADTILRGTSSMHHVTMSLSDFVACNGEVDIKPGVLAVMGQRCYDRLADVAKALGLARQSSLPSVGGAAFKAAENFVKFSRSCYWEFSHLGEWKHGDFAKEYGDKIALARKGNDLAALEAMFFGFHGIKNNMHNKLRKLVAAKATSKSYFAGESNLAAFWGDIDLAIEMLGRF